MKVVYAARAARNIEAAHGYLKKRSPAGATNVIAAIRAAAEFIAEQPFGSEATDLPDVRMKLVAGYPYKIFYRVRGGSIEIIHIRHTSRWPWRSKASSFRK